MIESLKEDVVYQLLPNIHEVEEFLDPKEHECNFGDILYNKNTKEIRQYGVLEFIDDEEDIKDTYKELIDIKNSDGELISNESFINQLKKIKEDMKIVSNTAETNNLPAYINKIQEMIDSGSYNEIEVKRLKRKIEGIESSLTMSYLRGMNGRIYKFDNKLYKKYKSEAHKKLRDNSKYTFPSINDILTILNHINTNEKENKLFLINFYKYIVDNKMDNIGITIYFTIINILGLVKEHNEYRDNIIFNLKQIIKYFN